MAQRDQLQDDFERFDVFLREVRGFRAAVRAPYLLRVRAIDEGLRMGAWAALPWNSLQQLMDATALVTSQGRVDLPPALRAYFDFYQQKQTLESVATRDGQVPCRPALSLARRYRDT